MAIKFEVKKVVFGFDKTKTEKFVAQTKVLGSVDFKTLCESTESEYGAAWRSEDGD